MPNDNLVVIAAMARKGGSGKTTLSRALISAAVAAGRQVMLIDTDSTGVLSSWHARAEGAGYGSPHLLSSVAESVAEVDRMIERVYVDGSADFIFIDTAGVGAEWSDEIAVLADHIVTPVMLSTSDFDVGGQTVDWFRQLAARVDDASALHVPVLPSHWGDQVDSGVLIELHRLAVCPDHVGGTRCILSAETWGLADHHVLMRGALRVCSRELPVEFSLFVQPPNQICLRHHVRLHVPHGS